MSEDLIQDLWEKGGEGRALSREEITDALSPRLVRGTRSVRGHLWGYLALLGVTLVLGGVNIAGYWHNPTMRWAQVALVAVAAGLAWFGIRLIADARLADRAEDSLLDAVRRRLGFFGPRYEAWAWMAGFAVLLLSLAINSLVDNQNGGYRINKPLVFAGTSLAVVLIGYASVKLGLHPVVRELRATLLDLEDQLLERTAAVDRWKHGWARWKIALAVLLTLTAALGAWLALQLSA